MFSRLLLQARLDGKAWAVVTADEESDGCIYPCGTGKMSGWTEVRWAPCVCGQTCPCVQDWGLQRAHALQWADRQAAQPGCLQGLPARSPGSTHCVSTCLQASTPAILARITMAEQQLRLASSMPSSSGNMVWVWAQVALDQAGRVRLSACISIRPSEPLGRGPAPVPSRPS